MNNEQKTKTALTLVEMLTVTAIIVILAAIAIGIATRIDNQSKERLTENTFALLNAALGQFQDYGYNYKAPGYQDFDFPLDCNGYSFSAPPIDIKTTLIDALGATDVSITGGGTHSPDYSGSEVLYFFLSQVPTSRKTLDKIDSSLITARDADGNRMEISIDGRQYPLLRVIDPWGQSSRYRYYETDATGTPDPATKRNFPVITSAGPDEEFGTADDMSSRNRN